MPAKSWLARNSFNLKVNPEARARVRVYGLSPLVQRGSTRWPFLEIKILTNGRRMIPYCCTAATRIEGI